MDSCLFALVAGTLICGAVAALGDLDPFQVSVGDDGSYAISLGNKTWLKSAPTWIQAHNKTFHAADGSLILLQSRAISGEDNLGSWAGHQFQYRAHDVYFNTKIHQYTNIPAVRFQQTYLNDTHGTSMHNKKKVVSGFPSFAMVKDKKTEVGCYAPRGYQTGWDSPLFARWNTEADLENGHKMGPLALFDQSGHTIVMSHFNNFMAASYWFNQSDASFNIGPIGAAKMIPRGFNLQTILVFGTHGINQGFQQWGELMQKYYQSTNRMYGESDVVNNYLGYWTDNGACYYYATEPGKIYQDTILDIAAEMKHLRIPIRYIQYDSWFYPKDGPYGGLLEWIPIKSDFPNGLRYILNETGLSAACHSRWWSPQTPMAVQNGGKYEFIIEKKSDKALPIDPRFFDDILLNSKRWGNIQLNQDWLGQMFEEMSILVTNVTVGQLYMQQMAHGAQKNGIMIEMCTAYPRHTLTGLQIPTATVNRASEDYKAGNSQWTIGVNSLWVWSLGQSPFKDPFWTNSTMKCSKYGNSTEKRPALESVVASLSAGPVGWGDLIGYTDGSLLMRCCNEDGLILKPSRPATAIDALFYQRAFGGGVGPDGELWTTYSEISGHYFGIIFAANVDEYQLTMEAAGFGSWPGEYVMLSYHDQVMQPFDINHPMKLSNCTEEQFCLYYVSPVFHVGSHEVILHGEMLKWIVMSPKRIQQIAFMDGDIQLHLVGALNELVFFSVTLDGSHTQYSCSLGETGQATLSVMTGKCEQSDLT